jgi:hypothetical protein
MLTGAAARAASASPISFFRGSPWNVAGVVPLAMAVSKAVTAASES